MATAISSGNMSRVLPVPNPPNRPQFVRNALMAADALPLIIVVR
jgi:hypothetical protein